MQRMHNDPVSRGETCERNVRNFKLFQILPFHPFRSSIQLTRRLNFPFYFPAVEIRSRQSSINLLEALVEAISASQLAYLSFPRY